MCSAAVSGVSNGDLDAPVRQHRLDSFIPLSSRNSNADADLKEERYIGWGRCRIKSPKWLERLKFPNTIDPQSKNILTTIKNCDFFRIDYCKFCKHNSSPD